MAKAAKSLLQNTELLLQENRRLHIANADLSRKRAREVRQFTKRVTTEQALTVGEGREISRCLEQEGEASAAAAGEASQAPRRCCTRCRQPGHTRIRCPTALESTQIVFSTTET